MKKGRSKIFILIFLLAFLVGNFFVYSITLAASVSNLRISILPAPQCADGQDNDGDGKIDYPDDSGCVSFSDDSEATYTPPSGGGGGGGGGGAQPPSTTQVSFTGRAYPLSRVSVLKDGQVAVTTIAGPDSLFNVSLSGLASGNYMFSVYSEDSLNRRSSLFSFPIFITQGAITSVGGIFVAPTIALDKSVVEKGGNLAIFGQSAPSADVTISVHSDEEIFVKTKSDTNGVYLYNFDTSILETGDHLAKSKAILGAEASSFGNAISFKVGEKDIPIEPEDKCVLKADLNCDQRVNLVDFSIAAYWYKRVLSLDFLAKESRQLSGDGKLDLKDFSIMAFYWTG